MEGNNGCTLWTRVIHWKEHLSWLKNKTKTKPCDKGMRSTRVSMKGNRSKADPNSEGSRPQPYISTKETGGKIG